MWKRFAKWLLGSLVKDLLSEVEKKVTKDGN